MLVECERQVPRSMRMVQQSLDSPLSVAEVAKHLGIGKRRLERHFRSAVGSSPLVAFMDMRLSLARHLIENFFCKLKQFRAIATRYDKTARNFLAAVHLAAALIWLN